LLPGQTLSSALILPTGATALLGSLAAPILWIIEEVEGELVPVDWNVADPYLPGFGHYRYTVTCFNVAQIGSWQDFWKGRGGSGGGGGGGGGAVLAATTGGGLAVAAATVPLTIGWTINSGVTAPTVPNPILAASRTSTISVCKLITTTSDASVDLTFDITRNGTSIFTAPQTIVHGTAGGTLATITALTSSPLNVTQDDKFRIVISSGSVNWAFTVQVET
jgi:hypothetical protein